VSTPVLSTPVLSALVCTSDRAEPLRAVLESLCRQTLPRDAFEVVVVDDGSRDHTRHVVETFAGRLPLVASRQRSAGLASARNHALYLARGAIALFVDDDARAEPDLLERHVEAHDRWPEPSAAVLGFTRLDPAVAADPLMHFVTEVGRLLFPYAGLRPHARLRFEHFWGGRSSCKRRFLLEHGVFNPAFRSGGEDVELAYRLSIRGFHVLYEPRAVTTVIQALDLDGFCRRQLRLGEAQASFARLHPDAPVRGWAGLDEAAERWPGLAPHRARLVRTARALDQLARRRAEAGLSSGAEDLALLHAAYSAALEACRLAGIAAKAGGPRRTGEIGEERRA
jgi:hypothetical protein